VNELITATIRDGDVQTLNDFPTELMNEFETEIVTWISEYARKYAKLPKLERIERHFPHFIPLSSVDPIGDIFDRTVLTKKRSVATGLIAELTEQMRDDDHYDPTVDVSAYSRALSTADTGLVKYSAFDRAEYFKPRTPINFHFPLIDRVTGGLLNGDLCYMVGRLGHGKSTTAQWITHKWWSDGKRMLFVSAEMMPIDVLMRLDAMIGKFNPRELRLAKKTIALEKQVKVISHVAAAADGEIIFPKRRLLTPSAIIAVGMQLEVDAIVVDGVYLLRPDRQAQSKWERVAEISNALKQGAMELGIPILGITQLGRASAHKAKPEIEDIAYSDALGQDSDIVISIVQDKEHANQISLELLKNRFGNAVIGTQVTIDWDHMTLIDAGVTK
jgi:predicted ATP-dependent serine protease